MTYQPNPIAIPTDAENHTEAAVVRFFTNPPSPLRIIPAPIKPTPETICAAILAGEFGSTLVERKVNMAAPPMTNELVLIPAGLFLDSRSAPIMNPASRLRIIFMANSPSMPVIKLTMSASHKLEFKSFLPPPEALFCDQFIYFTQLEADVKLP